MRKCVALSAGMSALCGKIQEMLFERTAISRKPEKPIKNELRLTGDFHINLLIIHRKLRRLVVIESKSGRFMLADFGQTEFYLRWLDKYERKPWEESPIGLILCSEKSNERVELLALDKQEIKVAEYWTQLPDKKLLQQKLHDAVKLARELNAGK